MRAERDTLFRQLAQVAQREDLEPAGVRKHAPIPRHEAMEPAEFADVLMSRPKIEMIGVAEDNLSAEFFEDVLRNRLNAGDCADGHEHWRFNDAVRQLHAPDPSFAVVGFNCEGE